VKQSKLDISAKFVEAGNTQLFYEQLPMFAGMSDKDSFVSSNLRPDLSSVRVLLPTDEANLDDACKENDNKCVPNGSALTNCTNVQYGNFTSSGCLSVNLPVS